MTLAPAPLALCSVYSSISVPSGSLPNDFFSTFCAPSGGFASARRSVGITMSAKNGKAARQRIAMVRPFMFDLHKKPSKGYYDSSTLWEASLSGTRVPSDSSVAAREIFAERYFYHASVVWNHFPRRELASSK